MQITVTDMLALTVLGPPAGLAWDALWTHRQLHNFKMELHLLMK